MTAVAAPDFRAATRRYERWLRQSTPVVVAGLRRKHALMRADVGRFLRGTYYRWSAQFPQICPTLARTLAVLSVGDAHIENFGTWRDVEGRLVWGVNDVDEAWRLPVANDLVRVLTSALIARRRDAAIDWLSARALADALDAGYRAVVASGGAPYVLAESNPALRSLALRRVNDPMAWWSTLEAECRSVQSVPRAVRRLLIASLPAGAVVERWAAREAGVGSLGRERFVVIANFAGGRVAREAKPLLPSAAAWVSGAPDAEPRCAEILERAERAPDPCARFADGWIIRRLAPDCSRLVLDRLPVVEDQRELLRAMGGELANVHLGQTQRRRLHRTSNLWTSRDLLEGARAMRAALDADWAEYRSVIGPVKKSRGA